MTTNFNLNVDQCIETAIVWSGGQPSQFEELQNARTNLNLLFSEWSVDGVNLWKVNFADVTVAPSTAVVSLSSSVLRPIHIAARVDGSNSDIQLTPISYTDYNVLSNKEQQGTPTQYLVERKRDSVSLRLWPVPSKETILKLCVVDKFEDVEKPYDTVDAPSRFLPALTYGLSYRLALGRSDGGQGWEAKLNRLNNEYMRTWAMATGDDTDKVPLRITPRMR